MPRTPLLGYLQSAIADNTGQSDMDKLLFEDEMSNIQREQKVINKVALQKDLISPVFLVK